MDKPVIICGGPDIEARMRAYLQLVGRRRVSVASHIRQFSEAIVDIRGGVASKRLIPAWQQHGCTVISDGPLARTLAQNQELLDRGNLLLTLPDLRVSSPRRAMTQSCSGGGPSLTGAQRAVGLKKVVPAPGYEPTAGGGTTLSRFFR